MTARGVVIDEVTGAVKRKIVADPTQFGAQVGAGEALFALVDDDGAFINDAHVVVSEAGGWAVKDGAPETVTAPVSDLQYVAV